MTCMFIACGTMCQAQGGGGTFDTIRISRWTQASVAYHDSVVIYEEQPGIANAPARGFTRSNPSAPWDSVELVSSWHRQLPMKGCVMAGTRSEKTLELHWILRDAKAVRIDTTGRESDKIDYRPIRRIRVHPANPRKVYIQYEYESFGGTYTATMVTNDDGETWSEINPPSLSGDGGRGHSLGFNYREPQRTYIAVDPQNRASPDEPLRAYYTDDDGITFTQIKFSPEYSATLLELGVGIWSAERGIDFAYFEGKQRILFPVDSVSANGQRVTYLKEYQWLDSVRSSLFPSYDSTKQRLDYRYRYALKRDGYIDGFAFHPELPESFALAFTFDTLVANKWHSRIFVAATLDMGKTWSMIVPVTDLRKRTYQYPASLNFDPASRALYYSYQEARYDSATGETEYLNSYTIKWTPDMASSVDRAQTEDASDNLHVYPNPASQGSDVTVAFSSVMSLGSDESIIVTCSTLDGRQAATSYKQSLASKPQSTDRYTLSTSGLAPGVYIVQVQSRNRTDSKLLVVTH